MRAPPEKAPGHEASREPGAVSVVAKRGGSVLAPESTLRAYRSALALGVTWVEADVYRTRDGVPVVSHDAHTGRTGDRSLRIGDATYEELRRVDVAAAFRRERGLDTTSCPPARVPGLDEVPALVAAHPRARISLQPNGLFVREIIDLLRAHGLEARAAVNSTRADRLERAQEIAPELPVWWERTRGPGSRQASLPSGRATIRARWRTRERAGS